MITIKDIARLAKVSDGTVDRVIHNRGGVSSKTEERIRKILKEHNFSLNPIASALASKKNYRIGCLIPKHDKKNQFWKSPSLGILKAAEEVKNYGVQVEVCYFNQLRPSSYIRKFDTMIKDKPDIFILAPIFASETKYIANQLESLNIEYMFINIDNDEFNNVSFIGQNSHTAGYVAGKLMSLSLPGNSVCGIVQTRENIADHNAISNRIRGFEDYLKEHGVSIKTRALRIDLEDDSSDLKKIKTFLESDKNVLGLFVPSSRASYVASLLPESVRPSNCTLLGYDTTEDNIFYLKNGKIQFLISQRSFNQGYEAVRMMTDYLVQKKTPEEKIYSPIQIIIKENVDFDSRYKKSFAKELTNGVGK